MSFEELVFAVLTLIAATAAAVISYILWYPSWKASRRRPDLRLFVDLNGFQGEGEQRNVSMHVHLQNEGDGRAVGWRMTLTTERRRFFPYSEDATGGTCSDRQVGTGWRLTWQSRGADDTIEPTLDNWLLVALTDFTSDEEVVGLYAISARRMEERTGEVRVSHPPDHAEPSIVVT